MNARRAAPSPAATADAHEPHAHSRRRAAAIIQHATEHGQTLATAESCTGGLVASLLTDIPGASTVYLGGWVVYDNMRKQDDLDVPAALLEAHGAVSAPVAEALARGARTRSGATCTVATTGIAGPTGGRPDRPVGTLWIGIAGPDGAEAHHHVTGQRSRLENKAAFAHAALIALAEALGVDGSPARR